MTTEAQPTPKSRNIQQREQPLSEDLPQASAASPSEKARTYTFTVPKSARIGPHDPSTITMAELTADQVVDTTSRCQGDRVKAGFELAKASLHAVDGKRVDHGEFEAEIHWKRWSSKIRNLVVLGYSRIHNTEDREDEAFLGSMQGG